MTRGLAWLIAGTMVFMGPVGLGTSSVAGAGMGGATWRVFGGPASDSPLVGLVWWLILVGGPAASICAYGFRQAQLEGRFEIDLRRARIAAGVGLLVGIGVFVIASIEGQGPAATANAGVLAAIGSGIGLYPADWEFLRRR
ncbi:MAG: hypothetical protein ABIO70_27440 [Pseudomonadota bacterium]